MEILPNEVESVQTVGSLFDDDVKIIKCIGGFHVAVGRRSKRHKTAEALAAGSHPALVTHQLHKQFGSDFQPAIMKNESEKLPSVEEKTIHLSSNHIQSGLELFTLQKDNNIQFIVSKHGVDVCKYEARVDGDKLLVHDKFFNKNIMNPNRELANSIAKSMGDKLYELNLSTIEYDRD